MARCITYKAYPAGSENAYVIECYTADVGGGNQTAKPWMTAKIDKNQYDAMTAAEKTGTANTATSVFFTNLANSLAGVVEVT